MIRPTMTSRLVVRLHSVETMLAVSRSQYAILAMMRELCADDQPGELDLVDQADLFGWPVGHPGPADDILDGHRAKTPRVVGVIAVVAQDKT